MNIDVSNKNDYMNVRMALNLDNKSGKFLNNPQFVKILKDTISSILEEEYSKNITSMNKKHFQIRWPMHLLNSNSKFDSAAIKEVKNAISNHSRIIDLEQFLPNFTHNYAITTNITIDANKITIQKIRMSYPSKKSQFNDNYSELTALYFDTNNVATVEITITPFPKSTKSPSMKILKYDSNGEPINNVTQLNEDPIR